MGKNQSGKMRRMARSAGYTGTSSRHESAVSRANRCSIDKMAGAAARQQRERLQEVNEQKCQRGREQRTGKALLQ